MSTKRVRLISLTGIVLIVLIIGVSLLMNYLSNETQEIPLPDTSVSESPTDTTDVQSTNGLEHITITTDNVQNVIATLERPLFYSRSIQVYEMYKGDSTAYTIGTSYDNGATALKISNNGIIKNVIITSGTLYIWYDNDKKPYSRPLESPEDEKKASDEYQMMMSYEDVLELDKSSIMDAGYGEYGENGEDCIYVQYVTELLHYTVKCYISVDNGLLIYAEMYDGDTLVYKMTTSDYVQTPPDLSVFELPDGSNPVSAP